MSQPSDGPTIDLRPPDTAPTLTRVGDESPTREAPSSFAPPGYEILGELGRGGMGVVYRARQRSLNRIVALKVILGAGHAGAEQLSRFRAEATTAARLQHPNIVQVFEVGEHEGQPYFSLEFIEGGSLADFLKGEPQPPRDAAELVRTLALAVQHAHSKGVIHRDLKPANVLLVSGGAVSGESSQPPTTHHSPLTIHQPKITDFGLAKQQAADSKLTTSGAILGTPSYMAPEQAAGDGKAVGPATDVYALGAILYELLTGRPPFRAASVMDTVLQVMHDDPVPPSRLEPKLPRDLETICLKCLAKKPEQRYSTAAALADDLGRFLNGEPIHARPVSSVVKAWKWSRRHPALAAIVFILAVPLPAMLAVMIYLFVEARSAKQQVEQEKEEVAQAHQEAERERKLAQEYLQNALGTMDRILERIGDDRLSRIPAVQEERAAIMAEALAFFETLLRIDSTDPRVREETAQTFARMSRVSLMGGRTTDAAKAGQGSVDLYRSLADQFPDRPEYRNELAQAYMFLGHSHILSADFSAGLKAYESAAAVAEALAREFPGEPAYRATAAECRRSLGYFYTHAGPTGGEEHFKEGMRLAEELFRQHPHNAEYRALLLSLVGGYSQLLALRGRTNEAAPLVARGLELTTIPRDKLPRKGNARLHLDQGTIQVRLAAATLAQRAGRKDHNIELLRDATAGFEKVIATQSQAFPFRLQALQAYIFLTLALSEKREIAEATRASARALELFDEILRDFPIFADQQKTKWFHAQGSQAMVLHARNLIDGGRVAEAAKLADRLDAATVMAGVSAYNVACVFARLAGSSQDDSSERFANYAMNWLKKAAANDYPYPSTPGQVEHVRTNDADLAALRSRPEFQEWVKTLKPVGKK
jgi:serine/threonine protein kinase